MSKILIEVFKKNCYEVSEMKNSFSESYEIKKTFTEEFKNIYKQLNKELIVNDLDYNTILIIKYKNININIIFTRSYSSFWYKVNLINVETGQTRKYNYQRDNCLSCPEKLIKSHDLYEIIRLVEDIS